MSASPEVRTESTEPLIPYPGGSKQIVKKGLARYLTGYMLASVFLFACYQGLLMILLPNQAQDINRTAGEAQGLTGDALTKFATDEGAKSIGLITGIAAFFTLFAQPIVGFLSDRYRSRWGRRSTWIIVGAVLGALFMVGLRSANTIVMVTVFWVLVQVSLNFMQAPLQTTVADRVPEDRRGKVSGISGIGTMIGAMGGGIVAGALMGSIGLNAYYFFGIAVVLGSFAFVLLAPDTSSKDLVVPSATLGDFFKGFIQPLKDHDFRWAWLARFALIMGYQAVGTFTLFMLQDYVREHLNQADATATAPLLAMVSLPGMLVGMFVGGFLSDKLKRRKVFVLWASIGLAICLCVPLLVPTIGALYFYNAAVGLFFGVYMAVDMALFIDVLPNPADAGRDLGVANVATNIPQAIAPLAGSTLLAMTGSYASVWAWGAVWAIVAGLAIIPIKKVR